MYFYIFAVMTQARCTFITLGTQWSPKWLPGGANGNSKLIYALLFILLITCKELGKIKTYTFLKTILLYIVATMTEGIISCGTRFHHCWKMTNTPLPQQTWREWQLCCHLWSRKNKVGICVSNDWGQWALMSASLNQVVAWFGQQARCQKMARVPTGHGTKCTNCTNH